MEFAKDAPPEMLPKLLETCKWQADNDGKCKINCSSCPGAAAYNDGSGCGKNGWADGNFSASDKSPTTKNNAESFIEHHTKAKPAHKKPQLVVMPDHLMEDVEVLKAGCENAQKDISDMVEQLKRARQRKSIRLAAYTAALKRAKQEARK